MRNLTIFLLLLCVGCGYSPIYKIEDQLIFEFNEVIIEGDEKIKRQIINTLVLKPNLSVEKSLLIKTNYKTEETSKNSKGQIETYRSIINAEITINEGEKNLIKENFSNEYSYNNQENQYELRRYQDEIRQNLTQQLVNEIILFLKLL